MSNGNISETDSDIRDFYPGRFIMRQLTRSVSRRTKQLLSPTKAQGQPQHLSNVEYMYNSEVRVRSKTFTSSNCYSKYEFFDHPSNSGRSPPEPSCIHRRSVSFDNLLLYPLNSFSENHTQLAQTPPTTSSPGRSNSHVWLPKPSSDDSYNKANPTPHHTDANTDWNATSVSTNVATVVSTAHANTVLSNTNRVEPGWTLGSHNQENDSSPSYLPSTDTNNEACDNKLEIRTRSVETPPLTLDTRLVEGTETNRILFPISTIINDSVAGANAIDGSYNTNRESFSGPAELDLNSPLTHSQQSSIYASENNIRHLSSGMDPKSTGDRDSPITMAAPTLGATQLNVTNINTQNSMPGQLQAQNPTPLDAINKYNTLNTKSGKPFKSTEVRGYTVLPSAPLKTSGLRGTPSPETVIHTSKDQVPKRAGLRNTKRRGNLARVLTNLTKGIVRMRSNRSASQPATPAETQKHIQYSIDHSLIQLPGDTKHVYFKYQIDPTAPAPNRSDSPLHAIADSATISRRSSPKYNMHRRSHSTPLQEFDEVMITLDPTVQHQAQGYNPSDGSSGSVHVKIVQSSSSLADQLPHVKHQPQTFSSSSMVNLVENANNIDDTARSLPLHKNIPLLSDAVMSKLTDDFLDSVCVSSRFRDDHTESSYGSFIRFHNSGELTGIVVADSKNPDERNKSKYSKDNNDTCSNQESNHIDIMPNSHAIEVVEHDDVIDGEVDATQHRRTIAFYPDNNETIMPGRGYDRNSNEVQNFIENVRVQRQISARKRAMDKAQQQALNNQDAVLAASIYIHKREMQEKMFLDQTDMRTGPAPTSQELDTYKLGADIQEKHQHLGRSTTPSPKGNTSTGKMGAQCINRRRRASIFGVFCGHVSRDTTPSPPLLHFQANPVPFNPQPNISNQHSENHADRKTLGRDTTSTNHTRSHSFSSIEDTIRFRHVSADNGNSSILIPWDKQHNYLHDVNNGTNIAGTRDAKYPINTFKDLSLPSAPGQQTPNTPGLMTKNHDIEVPNRSSPHRRGIIAGFIDKIKGKSGSKHKNNDKLQDDEYAQDEYQRPLHGNQKPNPTANISSGNDVFYSAEAQKAPPPNVNLNIAPISLTEYIIEDITNGTMPMSQSSTQKRIYGQFVNSLRRIEMKNGKEVDANLNMDRKRENESSNGYPNLGLGIDPTSVVINHHQASMTPAVSPVDTQHYWRDSAMTDQLTQGTTTDMSIKGKEIEWYHFLPQDSILEPGQGEFTNTNDAFASDENYISENYHERFIKDNSEGPNKNIGGTVHTELVWDNQNGAHSSEPLLGDPIYNRKKNHFEAMDKCFRVSKSAGPSDRNSRATSADGFFDDLLHSGAVEIPSGKYRTTELPGVEGISTPSSTGYNNTKQAYAGSYFTPPDEFSLPRIRDTDQIISRHDNCPEITIVNTSFESRISETGTGMTQIFEIADINADVSDAHRLQHRRPSAKPAIKDVSDIIWGVTNPTATVADITASSNSNICQIDTRFNTDGNTSTDTRMVDQQTEQDKPFSSLKPPFDQNKPLPDLPSSDGIKLNVPTCIHRNTNSFDKRNTIDTSLLGPIELVELVRTVSDPRELVYDSGSQFGSVNPKKTKSLNKRATPHVNTIFEEKPRIKEIADDIESNHIEKRIERTPSIGDAVFTGMDKQAVISSADGMDLDAPAVVSSTCNQFQLPHIEVRQNSMHTNVTGDSDALAGVSTQAIHSRASPAVPTQTVHRDISDVYACDAMCGRLQNALGYNNGDQTLEPPSDRADNSKIPAKNISLQEYLSKQKPPNRKHEQEQGLDQHNFRLSLLSHSTKDHIRKPRSLSLPSSQSIPRPLLGCILAPMNPPSGIALTGDCNNDTTQQPKKRTMSVYDWDQKHFVNTSLQHGTNSPRTLPTGIESLAKELGEDLADTVIFSNLLGDGAALASSDIRGAKRHSCGLPLMSQDQPLFDLERDIVEDDIPESALRAFSDGGYTAVERFFEHIMRITTPSTIFEGDIAEADVSSIGIGSSPSMQALRRGMDKRVEPETHTKEARDTSPAMNGFDQTPDLSQQHGAEVSSPIRPTPTNRETLGAKECIIHKNPLSKDASTQTTKEADNTRKPSISMQEPQPRFIDDTTQTWTVKEANQMQPPASDHLYYMHQNRADNSPSKEIKSTDQTHKAELPLQSSFTFKSPQVLATSGILKGQTGVRSPDRKGRRGTQGSRHRNPPQLEKYSTRDRKMEHEALLTKLRVFETLLRKAEIEESRLQPVPVIKNDQIRPISFGSLYTSGTESGYSGVPMNSFISQQHHDQWSSSAISQEGGVLLESLNHKPDPPVISDQTRTSSIDTSHQNYNVLNKLRRNPRNRAGTKIRRNMVQRAIQNPESEKPIEDISNVSINVHVVDESEFNRIHTRSVNKPKLDRLHKHERAERNVFIPSADNNRFSRTSKILGHKI